MSEVIKLDVEGVVKQKTNGKAPRLLIWFLKHILHEQTFNTFFREHPYLKDYDFIREVTFGLLQAKVSIQGTENIPNKPRLMFVSNHPLGGLDGMIIALMLAQEREYKVKVIVNEFLMALKPLHGVFVPVSVAQGRQSRKQVEQLQRLYLSDYDILSFPSGKCSRKIDGEIQDPEWKKSFVQKAVEHHRDVVPIYFEGKNSRFFYNLALWRTRLGIKQNIEMLFLANEMFKAKGKQFTVRIGKPISYAQFDSSKSPAEWANTVREHVYQLKNN